MRILIVAPANDAHAACVAQHLTKSGHAFQFVDSSQMSTIGRAEFRAGKGNTSTWLSTDGTRVALGNVKTVWYRRRYLPPLPETPNIHDRDFMKREWLEFFFGLFASMNAWFVNDPVRHHSAVKPLQLRLAGALGLRIPDTLITNDPSAAEDFVRRHRGQVVYKTLSPARKRWLGTSKWKEADRSLLDGLVVVPTIFQEAVTDCRELRITIVGNDVFAAEFRPPIGVIDGRLAGDVPYRPHLLPDVIHSALLELMRRLGLVYSTVDMKLTEEGEYVFLELNPQGQFLYIEILCGFPISSALAALLSSAAPA